MDRLTEGTYPTEALFREKPMASWNVKRRDSCTSSPHSPLSNRFVWRSARIGKRTQRASLAVMLPSEQVTRLVIAAERTPSVHLTE